MAHFPKPFFKKARGLWYVEINRQQFNLGADREAAEFRIAFEQNALRASSEVELDEAKERAKDQLSGRDFRKHKNTVASGSDGCRFHR